MILNSPLGIVLGFFLGFSLIAAAFFGLNRSRHQQSETSSVFLAHGPTASSIARQVLMTWNSWLSFGFDLIFGVLPALYLAFVCLLLLLDPELRRAIGPAPSMIVSGYSVLGLIASIGFIYVSLARGKTQHKPILKVVLAAGVALAFLVPSSLWISNFINRIDNVYQLIGFIFAVETPVVIVAIKHIIMLTRA
jgi:hypothetical protein